MKGEQIIPLTGYTILSAVIILGGVLAILAGCTNRTILNERDHAVHNLVEANPKDGEKHAVWFIKSEKDGVKLQEVARPNTGGDRLRNALTELLSGPTAHEAAQGLGTEIPQGTLLLGITENGNTVDLNVSRRFASQGGPASFMMRLAQLKRTVAGVAAGKKIYLDVEGKRLNETMGDGLEVHQPIN